LTQNHLICAQNPTILSDHTHISQYYRHYRSVIRHYIKRTQNLKHAVYRKKYILKQSKQMLYKYIVITNYSSKVNKLSEYKCSIVLNIVQ